MSLATLTPPPARTIHASGDMHIGKNLPAVRYNKLRDAYNRTDSAMAVQAAVNYHVGDVIEGNDGNAGNDIPTTPGQDAVALPWLASFTGTTVVSVGNHDISERVVPGVASPTDEQQVAQWASDYGRPAQAEFDCDHFRLLVTYWSLQAVGEGLNRRDWLEGRVADAGAKPVILGFHFPTRDSVNSTFPAGHGTVDTWGTTNYGPCLTAGSDGFVKDLANRYGNVRAFLHGHIHPWYDSGNMAFMQDCGGRRVLSVNLSANTYVAGAFGNNRWRSPIHGYYLSVMDDELQLRVRDHGAGVWLARNRISRVERFPFPD